MLCTWFLCAAAGATYSWSLLRDATKEIGDVCTQANIWRRHTTLLPGGPSEDQKWLNLVRPAPWQIPISGSLQRVRLVPNGKFLPMILVMESGYVARQTPLLYMFLCIWLAQRTYHFDPWPIENMIKMSHQFIPLPAIREQKTGIVHRLSS